MNQAHCAVAPPGLITLDGLTQGSQNLALGLTLTAAPQLVEYLRFHEARLPALSYAMDDARALSFRLTCCRKSA